MHVANLDPAAEEFAYDVAFDIRSLIAVDDVMEELGYGPNGGLLYCMGKRPKPSSPPPLPLPSPLPPPP